MRTGLGKVILLGEHSVVYGHSALAAALAQGAHAWAEPAEAFELEIDPWQVRVSADAQSEQPLARAFAALVALHGQPAPVRVRATIELPGGAGLGSSAALGVAVLGALDEVWGVHRSPADLAESSLVWERVFHGNPSGVDSAMAALGGLALFRRGQALEPLRVRKPLQLVVAGSGESSSTEAMVDSVAAQRRRDPQRIDQVFEAIEALVRSGRAELEAGDARRFGQLMDMNHMLLAGLMLSTPRLEEMCVAARAAGAWGAKLTGAGGGGCMIAAVEDASVAAAVQQALQPLSAQVFATHVGGMLATQRPPLDKDGLRP